MKPPFFFLLRALLKEQAMIQPDFRKMLKVLAQRAKAAKKYQGKHGQPPPTPLVDNSKDLLYQLSCVAQEVSIFQNQRLAVVAGSKEANALSALLRLIKNHGGHRGHPVMVLINSGGLLSSLYPCYARNPVNAYKNSIFLTRTNRGSWARVIARHSPGTQKNGRGLRGLVRSRQSKGRWRGM